MKNIVLGGLMLCGFTATGQVMVETISTEFAGSGGVTLSTHNDVYIGNFGDFLNNGVGEQVGIFNRTTGEVDTFSVGHVGASGNDFDSEGNLFQSNIGGNRIMKVAPDGVATVFTTEGISAPVGLIIDSDDNLFVANCGSNTIQMVTSAGNSSTFASGTDFNCPNGITQDGLGNLYVSNFSDGRVVKIDGNGNSSVLATLPGNNNGHLTYANERLYVASHGGSRIFQVELDGSFKTLAGTPVRGNKDGDDRTATLSLPNGIIGSVTGDTLYFNTTVPLQFDNPRTLNPALLRMVTGVHSAIDTAKDTTNMVMERSMETMVHFLHRNPLQAGSAIQLKCERPVSAKVVLMSLTGEILFSEQVGMKAGLNYEWKLPSTVASGVYLFTIHTEQGIRTNKIVVE